MLQKLLYLKLCWARASSHFSILSSIGEKILLAAVFLKVFGWENIIGALVILGAILVLSVLLTGHYDLKCGIAAAETSLANKYNPEIQELVKHGRKNSRRI